MRGRTGWIVVALLVVVVVAAGTLVLSQRGSTGTPATSPAARPSAPPATSPASPPVTSQPPPTHPGTVLLVPGYGGGTGLFGSMVRRLEDQGYRTAFVDVGDGTGDLNDYARTLEEMARAEIAGGRPAPDVVGYSAGGLTARIAASADRRLFGRIITLGTPNAGTTTADFGASWGQCPAACQQMRPGSELLDSLPVPPPRPGRWLSVWSDTDHVIQPTDSSVMPDVVDYRLQQACPGAVEHIQLLGNRQSLAVVTAFLAGQPLPTSCLG